MGGKGKLEKFDDLESNQIRGWNRTARACSPNHGLERISAELDSKPRTAIDVTDDADAGSSITGKK